MDEHQMNELFRRQMGDFEASPPEEAWENIQNGIKRERKIAFLERLAAVIVLLFLTSSALITMGPHLFQNHELADATTKPEESDTQEISKTPSKPIPFVNERLTDPISSMKEQDKLIVGKKDPVNHLSELKNADNPLNTESHGNSSEERPEEIIPINQRHNLTPDARDPKSIHNTGLPHEVNGLQPQEEVLRGRQPEVIELPHRVANTSLLVRLQPETVTFVPANQQIEVSQLSEEPIIEKKAKRFELFAMGMPSLFYHNLETNTGDNVLIGNLEERSAISSERIGYKAAFGGTFKYGRKLELFAGLIYAWADESFNFTRRTITSYETSVLNAENMEFIVEPQFSESDYNINLKRQELGLQLGAAISLHRGRVFEQGIGANIAFHRNLIGDSGTDFDDTSIRLKKHFSYISVFYKLDYRLLPRLDLILQPTFNYSTFINESDSSPVFIKPNNLSLNFGISYHL